MWNHCVILKWAEDGHWNMTQKNVHRGVGVPDEMEQTHTEL
jgi:hypothetical protein